MDQELADASSSLTRRQHFSARNDVKAAIMTLGRQIENSTTSIDAYFTPGTILPNFIPIPFETTEP